MTSSANSSIGLVDLPTLADPVAAAGFRVVGGGTFREAAAEIKTAAESGPIAAIFVADHPQPGVKAWLTRMASHGAVVVIVRADVPRLEVDYAVSVDLPATVAELLAAAGLDASSSASATARIGVDGETADLPASAAPSDLAILRPGIAKGTDCAGARASKLFESTAAESASEPPIPVRATVLPRSTVTGASRGLRAGTSDDRWSDDPARSAAALPVAPLRPAAQHVIPQAAADEPFHGGVPMKFAGERRVAHSDQTADIGERVAPVVRLPLPELALRQTPTVAASPWNDAPTTRPAATAPNLVAPAAFGGATSMHLASPWDAVAVQTALETAAVTPLAAPAPIRQDEWFGAAKASFPGLGIAASAARILTAPPYQPGPDPVYTGSGLTASAQHKAVNPHDAVEAMFAAAAETPDSAPWAQPRRVRGHGSPVAIVCAEKGGVGKTNMTLALCQRAADLAPNKRVVLIDMNRGQGDIRKYLKLGGAQVPSVLDAAISGNIANAVLSPEQVSAARHPLLPPISFGVVLAPEPEAADPRIVTPDVYQRVIDMVRDRADLVVVDTQIVEIYDTSGLVDGLIVPALAHDAYGVTLTDTSAPGVQNLVTMLVHFARQGVPANRLMIVVNRALQGYDTNVLRGILTKYGTFAGAVEEKSLLARQANMGRIPHTDPALAPVLDAVLLRVTGWPCFQPVPAAAPAKKKLFSFGRRSA